MNPIPIREQQLLNNNSANFSLLSPRLVEWPDTLSLNQKDSSNTNMMQILFDKSNMSFSTASYVLRNIRAKQKRYIDSLRRDFDIVVNSINAKTISPFVTGLGSGHPTETGLILDRNSGFPYIPASSIKGVLRLAYALNLYNENSEEYQERDNNGEIKKGVIADNYLKEFFGNLEQRGALIILDAFPIYLQNQPIFNIDLINPHFRSYYEGTGVSQPVETESPSPKKFLTVRQGTQFTFHYAYLPVENKMLSESEKEKVKSKIDAMFKTAFETVGFGGKTAIGYGRFKEIKEK